MGGKRGISTLGLAREGKFTYSGIFAYIDILVCWYIGNICILVAKWLILHHPVRQWKSEDKAVSASRAKVNLLILEYWHISIYWYAGIMIYWYFGGKMVDFESPSQWGGNEGSALWASRAKVNLLILEYLHISIYWYAGILVIFVFWWQNG